MTAVMASIPVASRFMALSCARRVASSGRGLNGLVTAARYWRSAGSRRQGAGNAVNLLPPASSLHVQSVLVRYAFAEFQVAFHDPEIHRPAVAGNPVMVVVLRPPKVVKPDLGGCARTFQLEADPGALPVFIGASDFQLERLARLGAGHLRPPIVFGSEPE